jgi:FecR protein
MTGDCPAPEALARAVSEGAPEEMTEHVASCEACGREWESAKRLRQLANELPFETLEPERVLAVRSRVVHATVSVRRFTVARSALYVALAAAAAAVAIAIGGPVRAPIAEEPAPRYHGSVVAADGARWSRRSAAPDEVVDLFAGTIHVQVTPLGPGERFRIHAGDGEVEVRGTAFDVSVEAGHMTQVAVDHGRVEVRGAGAPQTVLGAGDPPIEDAEETRRLLNELASPQEPAPPASVPHRAPSPKPAPTESQSAATPEPPIAERSVVVPPPVVPPSPPVVAPPSPAPVVPKTAPPPEPKPASTDDRAREEDRRERREERRERQDSRRVR